MTQKDRTQQDEFWHTHVKKWETSEKSRREYCAAEGISYWTFRDRLKRITTGHKSGNTLYPVPREIYQRKETRAVSIDLLLPGDITLRIARGFDGQLLREILRELGVRQ